jgi:V8-like Glu-specific endopeptidase
VGATTTCTFYSGGRATRRCVQHGKKAFQCHALHAGAPAHQRQAGQVGVTTAGSASPFLGVTAFSSASSSLNWQGWPSPNMRAVGRVTADIGDGVHVELCSGTMVTRTLVLTAGHCVWNDKTGDYYPRIVFSPGQSWNGVVGDRSQVSTPYGAWQANRYWTTSGYAQGDASLDWGLIEIGPNSAGQYLGDIVGTWAIRTGIQWNAGARVYAVGYPSAGYWETDQGYNARAQYACDSTYDSEYQAINTGYELWVRCTMTPGASGGPWFVQLGSEGTWVIGGVTNRCWGPGIGTDKYCQPNSDWLRSSYLDSRFLDFWAAVQPQLTWR